MAMRFLRSFFPNGLDPAGTIKDPTAVLRAAIAAQTFVSTGVIQITTKPLGEILNIPFVVQIANATQMDAIFWIETVAGTGGNPDTLQLQYTQLVQLNFNGLTWPHVTVATLEKQ